MKCLCILVFVCVWCFQGQQRKCTCVHLHACIYSTVRAGSTRKLSQRDPFNDMFLRMKVSWVIKRSRGFMLQIISLIILPLVKKKNMSYSTSVWLLLLCRRRNSEVGFAAVDKIQNASSLEV